MTIIDVLGWIFVVILTLNFSYFGWIMLVDAIQSWLDKKKPM